MKNEKLKEVIDTVAGQLQEEFGLSEYAAENIRHFQDAMLEVVKATVAAVIEDTSTVVVTPLDNNDRLARVDVNGSYGGTYGGPAGAKATAQVEGDNLARSLGIKKAAEIFTKWGVQ